MGVWRADYVHGDLMVAGLWVASNHKLGWKGKRGVWPRAGTPACSHWCQYTGLLPPAQHKKGVKPRRQPLSKVKKADVSRIISRHTPAPTQDGK